MIKKITILKIVLVAMIWGGFVVQAVSDNQEIIHGDGADVVRDYQKAAEQGDVDAQDALNEIKQSTFSSSDMLDKSLSAAGVVGAFVGGILALFLIIGRTTVFAKFFAILIIFLILSAFINSFIFFWVGALIVTVFYIAYKFAKKSTFHDEMEGYYKKVVADLNKEIELNRKNANVYGEQGFAKVEIGDYKGAISDFDKAIKLDPNRAAAYGSRGIAKNKIGDYKGAIADYDRAIELEPRDAVAYSNRGIAKNEIGNHKGAIADYDRAIELDPENAYRYRESMNTAKEILNNQFKLTQPTLQSQLRAKLHKIVDILKKSLFHVANLLVFGVVFEFWDCSNANWMMSSGALLFFSCYIIYWPYYRIHGEYDWTTCKDFYPEPFLIKVSTLFCVWGLIMLLAGGSIWLWCPS